MASTTKTHITVHAHEVFPWSQQYFSHHALDWVIWVYRGPKLSIANLDTGNNVQTTYRQNSNISRTIVGKWNCWSLRRSWSIACRHFYNYIFMLVLTLDFNGLGKNETRLGLGATYIRGLMASIHSSIITWISVDRSFRDYIPTKFMLEFRRRVCTSLWKAVDEFSSERLTLTHLGLSPIFYISKADI